jgi:hypothetical protein
MPHDHRPVNGSPILNRRAIAMFVATIALCAVAATFILATWSTPIDSGWGFRGYAIILAIGAAVTGLVLSVRVPDNRVGWILAGMAFLSAIQGLADEYVAVGRSAASVAMPAAAQVAWLDGWVWVWPVVGAAVALPLTFPTGRFQRASDRWIAWFGVVAVIVSTLGLAVVPGVNATLPSMADPFHLGIDPSILTEVSSLSLAPLALAAVLSAGSVVRRFRRSQGEVRQQLKWFALAISGIGVALGIGLTLGPAIGGAFRSATSVAIIASFLGLIAAIGIAVLRYRLYDIDRIVSRSISYGLVTALLVASYTAVVLVLQGPLGSFTGGDTIPVAISTLAVAALFQPVRRRVQHVVDQRFDRARFDAERTTAAFAERLREQVDLPMLAADLDATVQAAIAPSRIGLWLRGDDG